MRLSYWVFGLSAALPNMAFQLTPLALPFVDKAICSGGPCRNGPLMSGVGQT